MRSVVLLSTIFVVTCLLTFSCSLGPPLTVTVHDGMAEVDVQSLGEYLTPVAKISISSAQEGHVIWEVVNPRSSPIDGFQIAVGENPVLLQHLDDFGFRVHVPSNADTFELRPGIEYVVAVWSKQDRGVSRENFVLED